MTKAAVALLCAAALAERGLRDRHAQRQRRRHRPRWRRPVGARPGRLLSPRQRPLAEGDRVPGRQGLPRLVRRAARQDPGRDCAAWSRRRCERAPTPTGSLRIADLYESFVDEAAVERAGIAPLAGELAVLDALQSPRSAARGDGPHDAARREHAAAHVHRPGLARRAALRAEDRPGRPRPARSRLLPDGRQVQGGASELPRLPHPPARALARAGRRGGVGARRARPGDGAGAGCSGRGSTRAIRSRPTPGSSSPALRAARARIRLAGVARRRWPRPARPAT